MQNIHKHKPLSSLTVGHSKKGGRNHTGHLTVRHRGGGHRLKLRILNLHKRWNYAQILRTEYDPNRTAPIILVLKDNKYYDYIIAPQVQTTQKLKSQNLNVYPQGTLLHNLILKYIKAAGTVGILLTSHTNKTATIKLPSKKVIKIPMSTLATIGKTASRVHMRFPLRKAGQLRLLGIRPRVKGASINAVDHPHGGSTKGGKPTQSRWGKVLNSPKKK